MYTKLRYEEIKISRALQVLRTIVNAFQARVETVNAGLSASRQTVQPNPLTGVSVPSALSVGSGPVDRLRMLQKLWDEGLTSQEQYETEPTEIIDSV